LILFIEQFVVLKFSLKRSGVHSVIDLQRAVVWTFCNVIQDQITPFINFQLFSEYNLFYVIGHAPKKENGNEDDDWAPIFIQWLDCVWQLLTQFPAYTKLFFSLFHCISVTGKWKVFGGCWIVDKCRFCVESLSSMKNFSFSLLMQCIVVSMEHFFVIQNVND
jgi:hypothetical protein